MQELLANTLVRWFESNLRHLIPHLYTPAATIPKYDPSSNKHVPDEWWCRFL